MNLDWESYRNLEKCKLWPSMTVLDHCSEVAAGRIHLCTSARLGTAVIPIQIDIGSGNVVTPGPSEFKYPVFLDQPAPRLYANARETVPAEQFEAMVAFDLANFRMKDFYDLLAMSRLLVFEGAILAGAIRATFERRETPVPPKRPPSLTTTSSNDPQRAQQRRSFLARGPLLIDEPNLPTVFREIRDFIMPADHRAIDGGHMPGRWSPDSGWRSAA